MSDVVLESIKYYVDKLIYQYNQKPNARATVELFITQVLELLPQLQFFENLLNIDDVEYDWQLDLIGDIVGIKRELSYSPPVDYTGYFVFGQEPITIENNGFFIQDKNDLEQYQPPFFSTSTLSSQSGGFAISNEDFKSLIKFKIILNNTQFFGKFIEEAIFNQFGNDIKIKTTYNEDMLFLVNFKLQKTMQYVIQQKLLPIPQNIVSTMIIFTTEIPLFSMFSSDSSFEDFILKQDEGFSGLGSGEPVSCFLESD